MTTHHHKSGSPLQTNPSPHTASYETFFKTLEGKLSTIEHELHKVLACYHFLNDSTRTVIAHSETPLPDAHHPWHLGMYLLYEWVEGTSQAAMDDIRQVNCWTVQQATLLQQEKINEKS